MIEITTLDGPSFTVVHAHIVPSFCICTCVLDYATTNRIKVGIGQVHDGALNFTIQQFICDIYSLKVISVF